MQDDVIELDLQELFMYLIHYVWILIVCGVITGVVGFAVSNFALTPMYDSTTSVFVLNKSNNSTISYSDFQLGTQLTKDYQVLITSRHVLEGVIEKNNLSINYAAMKKKVNVSTQSDTRIIQITVTDSDPYMAKVLADEIRELASKQIEDVMDIDAVNIIDEANLPSQPSSPNVRRFTLLGMLFGVFAAAAVLVIKFLLDDTIKTADDIERYLGISNLALIPIMEDAQKSNKKHKIADHSSEFDEEDETTQTAKKETIVVYSEDESEQEGV